LERERCTRGQYDRRRRPARSIAPVTPQDPMADAPIARQRWRYDPSPTARSSSAVAGRVLATLLIVTLSSSRSNRRVVPHPRNGGRGELRTQRRARSSP
jgi:hypothetical protein